jgi:hypothetical protein
MKKLRIVLFLMGLLMATPSVFSQKVELNLDDFTLKNDLIKSGDTVYVVEVANVKNSPSFTYANDTFLLKQNYVDLSFKISAYKLDKWRDIRKKIDTNDAIIKEKEAIKQRLDAEIIERQKKLTKLKNDKT